jgi:hypothetical protein
MSSRYNIKFVLQIIVVALTMYLLIWLFLELLNFLQP